MVQARQMSEFGFLVSHPTGNNFVRSLLKELESQKKLIRFFTTIGVGYEARFPLNRLQELRGYEIPDCKISRNWKNEVQRLLRKGNQQSKRRWVDRSYELLDEKVASKLTEHSASVIHAYEDGAASSFQRAKELGIRRSYELPIAHWKTVRLLLSEEAERYPEWEPTLESTREPEEKLLRKEKELSLASSIICPSDFVRQSIPKEIRDKTPCKISPFGSPSSIPVEPKPKDLKRGPFKVLFVGSMSQRKGLADLFKAMRILKGEEVRLSILGQPSMPMEFYRKQFSDFIYFPPTSNLEVTRIMQDHDALILPSIIEGRALVQQEALSCGLPIITTPNAGGADLIEEGMTGHLVPIRSPEIIAEKIISLADNKDCLNDLKIRCQQKAKTYTWQSYARKIIDMHS